MNRAIYLIDANLPRWFSPWEGSEYAFAHDFASNWPDWRLWEYACSNHLVVVTKDADFRILALAGNSPAKVVHVRLGNLRMRQFFLAMTKRWPEVVELLKTHRLVEVWPDSVVALS